MMALIIFAVPAGAQETLSATCGIVTMPTVVYAGQKVNARVRIYNTSSIDLRSDQGFLLGSQEPQDNATWGVSRVEIPGGVAPRFETTHFLFSVTAPTTPGTYSFAWQMLQEGKQWFGDVCKLPAPVTVQPADDNAKVFSISGIPERVTVGDSFTAVIKMQNRGKSTWQPGAYKLGLVGTPGQDSLWGVSRVALTDTVAPGEIATFDVHATAPSYPGRFPFQWQMKQEGDSITATGWFGSIASSAFRVRPLPPGATPLPTTAPETTPDMLNPYDPNPYDPGTYDPYNPGAAATALTAQITSPVSGTQVSRGQNLSVAVLGEGAPVCGTWKLVTPQGVTITLSASDFASGQLPGNIPACEAAPY